jgi:hypothetical protein
VQVALVALEAQQGVVAGLLLHRTVLPLGDEVVVGNPVVKKVAVGMLALSRYFSKCQ